MNPRQLPVRHTERLHIGRISACGARYFVTLVTKQRNPWLAEAAATSVFVTVLRRWHDEQDGGVLAATVMPDHAHVLFELGARTTVGQTVARWKSEARKNSGYIGEFQRDLWEHQVRESEALEDYALYIFLNPYRAGLLRADETWPGWWSPQPALFRFTAGLNADGAPPQEWIDWPDERFARLAHGE